MTVMSALSVACTWAVATGAPDGLMATATRPGPTNGVDQETESGDDFILTNEVQITSASFTGLVPLGVLWLATTSRLERAFRLAGPADQQGQIVQRGYAACLIAHRGRSTAGRARLPHRHERRGDPIVRDGRCVGGDLDRTDDG